MVRPSIHIYIPSLEAEGEHAVEARQALDQRRLGGTARREKAQEEKD
jgi:hypothetical protein